jgi:hypothetical protein
MQARRTLFVISLLAAGCSGGPASPTGAPEASAVPPTAAPPTAAVTATEAPTVSVTPASALEGTWTTGATTCAQQQAAADAAGFTADQLEAAGWDGTCGGLMHGSEFKVRFSGDRLVVFQDGAVGWDGTYQVVDSDTFEAGDATAGFYITYDYSMDDDELVIDMVRNDFPAASPDELAGEQLAQTVIYETATFTRVP